ncbi:MAG: hypothetical protein ACFFBT_15325 [Promethearchaeota archaeon]
MGKELAQYCPYCGAKT